MTTSLGQSAVGCALLHVYPDVQNETQFALYSFNQMVSCSIKRRPDFVLFTGDLTNTNSALEWARVQYAIARLGDAGIKWLVVPGNHDTDLNRNTLLNAYLSPGAWVTGLKTEGRLENSYSMVTMGGQEWLVICLEFGPRTAVVSWARDLLTTYASRPAVLLTHCYLFKDGQRYDWATYGMSQDGNPHHPDYGYTPAEGTSDGQDLWNSLVSQHSNLRLVLCGHNFDATTGFAESVRTDVRLGTKCVQLLQNYQALDNGSGLLREITIDSVNARIYWRTLDTVRGCPRVNTAAELQLPL